MWHNVMCSGKDLLMTGYIRLPSCRTAVCSVDVLRVELISRHEDQLTAITQLCKREMRLLIDVKNGATVSLSVDSVYIIHSNNNNKWSG